MTTRLTAAQLRSTIIKEEVAAVAAFVDAAPFDSSDSSMAGGGAASWDDQVEAAAEELRNAVSVALDGVVDKLYAGVYAR